MAAGNWKGNGMNGEAIGLVDIGTSKVVCLIAEPETRAQPGAGPRWRVTGVGHQRSRGLKAGVVTDVEGAGKSLRAAVSQAERAAGRQIAEVFLSVACGRLRSLNYAANADVETGIVSDNDIARVMAGGRAYAEREGRMLIHLNRYGFRLDGAGGVRDPRGMAGERLTADLHAVTADEAPLRNLLLVPERCYLAVSGVVAGPYASALAATSEEERRLGVTAIDFGGGTTSIAAFADGQLIHCDVMPVGANHITYDIARELQTPLAEAERIKALYATLVGAPSDEREIFSYPLTGEDDGVPGHTTKSELAKIVRPRVASLLGMIGERLERSGIRRFAGDRVVLTGGGAELVGIGPFAANTLARPVRVARPQPVPGLPASIAGPAFACASGLYLALASGLVARQPRVREAAVAGGYLGRGGQWLREGF